MALCGRFLRIIPEIRSNPGDFLVLILPLISLATSLGVKVLILTEGILLDLVAFGEEGKEEELSSDSPSVSSKFVCG